MNQVISIVHGSGGRQSHDLIEEIFISRFRIAGPLTDSAVIKVGGTLSFTTDSYVIDPIFFPGGDIGKLAVCGTVNDLAVSGADPLYLSAAFIIEDGFPVSDLEKIAESMASEAQKAGISIITGDTKVVERGKGDGIFITTAGVGILKKGREHIGTGRKVKKGDRIIINGPLGNHAIAILGARKDLKFDPPVLSDCASLNHLTGKILGKCKGVKFMRDITRGGLATILNELAAMTGLGITIKEKYVPVDDPVKGICETLGFDYLYLANEGKFLLVTDPAGEKPILDIMKNDPLGKDSVCIGEITGDDRNFVYSETPVGGRRILDMLSGVQLPRIC